VRKAGKWFKVRDFIAELEPNLRFDRGLQSLRIRFLRAKGCVRDPD
jgi:hypothetical protein